MKWATVFFVLGFLLVITTTCYFFNPPEGLNNKLHSRDDAGIYGLPNAHFNWCEPNYTYTKYIAEPFNTITSALYTVLCIAIWWGNRNASVPPECALCNFLVGLIGIGSVLFHATLRYSMQLCDELPMYWLVSCTTCILLNRKAKTGRDILRAPSTIAIASISTFLTCFIIITPAGDWIHEAGRGILATTFSIHFILIFVLANIAANEIEKAIPNSRVSEDYNKLFLFFVTGMTCWLLDNFYCEYFQSLPWELPYPQLHAFGWHCTTCAGLYYFFVILFAQRLHVQKVDFSKKYLWGISYIEIVKSS